MPLPEPNPRETIGANQPPTLPRLIADEQADFAPLTMAFLEDEHKKQREITAATYGALAVVASISPYSAAVLVVVAP
jgi:hypothetical protein